MDEEPLLPDKTRDPPLEPDPATLIEEAAARVEQADERTERAEVRSEEAKVRTEQAEARTQHAEARIDQAETRIEQAETRTGEAEARTEQAKARTEEAKARTEQAETRTEQAETRTEQAETRSEQAINDSELKYRRLFEAARDGILILDGDTGRVHDVNPFLMELLGFSHAEMVGRTVGELSPPKDSERNRIMLSRLQADGYVRYENLPLETKDGRCLTVEFVSNVYEVGGRKVIQCNIRDISQRKHSEMASTLLAAIVASSDDAIIGKDLNSIVSSWNQGAERIFGYTAGEMLGTSIRRLTPDDPDENENHILGKIQRGESVDHFETRRQAKDGRMIQVSIAASPIRKENGEIAGVSIIARDITARRHAEETLRVSQANMAVAQRIAHIGSWELDLTNAGDIDANALRWSDEMFLIAGYEPDAVAVTNELFFSLIPEAERAPVRAAVAEAIAGRERYSIVHQMVRPDGDVRTIREEGQVFFGEKNGQPEKIIGTAHDITDQRRVEEFVQMQASILNHMGQAVLATDLSGRIIYANRFAEHLYGWTSAELLGRNVVEVTAAQSTQEQGAEIMQSLQEGHVWSGEFMVKRRNGTEFPAFVTDAPLRDQHGALIGIIGISEDITERQKALEELRSGERQQRQLAKELAAERLRLLETQGVAHVGSWETDLQTMEVIWSEETYRIYEQPADFTPTYANTQTFVHPDDRARIDAAFREGMGQRGEFAIEHRLLFPDGRIKHIEERWRNIFNTDDQAVRATGSCHDITARKQAEEELRALNTTLEQRVTERTADLSAATHEAERANRAKSDFLSRMSHELRTPLHAILGFAQLLEMDGQSTEDAESVGQITRAGKHLLGLINEVLDLAAIESGKLELSLEPLCVRETLEEALSLVRPLAVAGGVQLKPLAGDLDCEVLSSERHFKQVIINLLSNAVKFNRKGGTTNVTCEKIKDCLRISIADTGRGISTKNLAKLFAPFERLGEVDNTIEGSGLGLSLSKHFVEAMGGRIGVESAVSKGSTFWVELPLVQKSPAAVGTSSRIAPPGALKVARSTAPRTLLYIEDNASNLRLVERIVARRPEITLLSAGEGTLGLELARQHHPDLILLDLHLPDMQGDEILDRLRAEPGTAATPIVMISADATAAQIARLRTAGVSDYLTKPIDVRQFLALVDAAPPVHREPPA